ncbi:SCO6880 family protein [Actinosynnema sp. NPDC047251]|uniref:Integral membrane protein n=1 Tax=Saccharothrix espanaensis (strain ATCC 51144 / DSM 44229 / JCM 9112 / NBRC 15066 / NRRL 15764) TaxID=1179773 RepID=K0JWZ2_SACES|nr:SCO6880 family protein [Saccharothrix espanaensis]CCH29299.1 Integral membrane protein [Saccharothrix espanaensis DSM 44229]
MVTAIRVRFSKRRSDGVLWGKTSAQLVCLVVALFTAVTGLNTTGVLKAVPLAVAGLLVAAALVPVFGRPLVDFAPILLGRLVTRSTGEHEYRGGPFRLRPHERVPDGPKLPGDLSRLRFHAYQVGEDRDRDLGVVTDTLDGGMAAALEIGADTFALLDTAEQAHRVVGFGAVLNSLCRSDSPLSRIQILQRVIPESGDPVRREWNVRGEHANPFAAAAYEELIGTHGRAGQRHESFLILKLDPRRAGARIKAAGGGADGAASVLFAEITRVERGLRSAGITVRGWLPPRGLAYLVRTAFDPAATAMLDRRGGGRGDHAGGDSGTPSGVDPSACHPMATTAARTHYATDSAVHRTWWIAEWPRADSGVPVGFLEPFLLRLTSRRTLSLVLEPIPARRAQTRIDVEAGADDARETMNRRIDRRTKRSDRREAEDLHRREAELVEGFAHFRFLGFISITATTREELEVEAGAAEAALNESTVEPHVLHWEQDQGFWAAALPLARGLR